MGHPFEFDINTGQRSTKYETWDLCNGTYYAEGQDQVSKFIMNYMNNVHPMPLDASPIDYDNSLTLLQGIQKVVTNG